MKFPKDAKLIECVSNFSTSNALEIDQIAGEIKKVAKVRLLDVDSNKDHNRTVVTFAGTPTAVKSAAFYSIAKAAELIDMSKHKGAHPRIGATDVCPFIPLKDITMDECVKLANELGESVGYQLGIPVYLYAEAAKSPERKNLADIRKGEYEKLEEKLKDQQWKPDYGPIEFTDRVKKTGATVLGAREILVAFNVNLLSQNDALAKQIAKDLRKNRDDGNEKFKYIAAKDLWLDSEKLAQVTMNLTSYKNTTLSDIYEFIKNYAERFHTKIAYSEIIGLIPKEALLMVGLYYIKKEQKMKVFSEDKCIDAAIQSLQIKDFDPNKKIIEYLLEID